jgi:hypothetical protein
VFYDMSFEFSSPPNSILETSHYFYFRPSFGQMARISQQSFEFPYLTSLCLGNLAPSQSCVAGISVLMST